MKAITLPKKYVYPTLILKNKTEGCTSRNPNLFLFHCVCVTVENMDEDSLRGKFTDEVADVLAEVLDGDKNYTRWAYTPYYHNLSEWQY